MTDGAKKGMINGATNRKKDSIKKDIFEIIKKSNNPISTQEIATAIKRPWHSVQNRCLQLQIEDKIFGFRVGRINLWQNKNE